MGIVYSVFTKPWKTMELARLGAFVSGLGFDGIELPVRPGYQVEPETAVTLPKAARVSRRVRCQDPERCWPDG